jgi:hypothetical protein
MDELSFKPELHGARFSRHEVPLEVLKDFAAFEELLIEVAKREYLDAHPGRLRMPRGFTKGLELRLSAIEEGSAKLALVLVGLSLADGAEYITRAHEKIVNTIENVGRGRPTEIPPELLRYFDRFGRSLLEGERIDFPRQSGGSSSLTPDVREKLLRASQAEEWTEEAILKGRVSSADPADGRFELELIDGRKLNAPFERQHNDTVAEALKGYRSNRMIVVKGLLKKDRSGNAKSIDSVEHVTLLDPLDIETRLEELGQLQDRWLNGRGVALDKAALRNLADTFDKNFDSELPLPYLYPTAAGAVLAEWSIGDWAVSLEIELPEQKAEYQAFNLSSDESIDLQLDLSNLEAWATLNQALRDLTAPRVG